MGSGSGIQSLRDYSSYPNNPTRVAAFVALLPDPDKRTTTEGFLDQLSPPAAAQLLVEGFALLLAVSNPDSIPVAPPGFIMLVDTDGAYLVDDDNYYLMEAI